MNLNETLKRICVGCVGVPLILFSSYTGRILFLSIVSLIVLLGLLEFFSLMEKGGYSPFKVIGIFSVLSICCEFYFFHGHRIVELIFVLLIFILIRSFFTKEGERIISVSVTLLGILYTSMFSSFILIRELPVKGDLTYTTMGKIVMFIFITIWVLDTSAYFFGSAIGRHPLFLRVSPRKTWEGSIYGSILAVTSAIVMHFIFIPQIKLFNILMICIIIIIAGHFGDFVESLFKREISVKDSSRILPGHGGILDRFDSSIFAAPAVYIYIILIPFS